MTIASAVPSNFARSSGRCVAMPTGHVSRWHERTSRQPSATSNAVPNETSSAPSSGGKHDVAAGLEAAVDADAHAAAQPGGHELPLSLGEAELPRKARVLDRRQRARTGAPVGARDMHDVGERLGDAGGDDADARLRDELHGDIGVRVHLAKVEDELCEILDRVDVVVRRRRDKRDARRRVPQPRDVVRDLVAGKLPAFAGLRALRHLDLQLLRVHRVLRRHAEPSGRDLLDARVPVGAEALAILAALSGVGARAEPVEGLRDRLVSLCGERAVRHAAAREALHDRLDGLDLFQWDRLGGGHELEQVARLERRAAVDDPREPLVVGPVAALRGRLQRVDDRRRRGVRLAALAPLHVAGILERGRVGARERLLLELLEADAAERRRRSGEAQLDHLGREAEDVEELSAAIRGDVRDAHPRHRLEHAVLDRAAEAQLRLAGRRAIAAELVGRRLRGERLEREPRADRVGAVAEEAGEVMALARLVTEHNEGAARSQSRVDERALHGAEREQRRDRSEVAAVVEHEQIGAGLDGADGFRGETIARAVEVADEGRVEPDRSERVDGRGKDEEALELEQRAARSFGAEQRRAARRAACAATSPRARAGGRSAGS